MVKGHLIVCNLHDISSKQQIEARIELVINNGNQTLPR